MSAQWLDKSDYVAAWQSEFLAAVAFCTADCLPQLRNIDSVKVQVDPFYTQTEE